MSVRRGERRGRLRFRGRISPAVDGEQVLIQKLRLSDGVWLTVGETFTATPATPPPATGSRSASAAAAATACW